MALLRRLPAEVFGKVTARLGGEIHYIPLGRRVVIAWRVKGSEAR